MARSIRLIAYAVGKKAGVLPKTPAGAYDWYNPAR